MTHTNYAANLSLEKNEEKALKLWLPYGTQTTKGSLEMSHFAVMYIPICGFTYFLHINMGLWIKMFSVQAITFSIAHNESEPFFLRLKTEITILFGYLIKVKSNGNCDLFSPFQKGLSVFGLEQTQVMCSCSYSPQAD